MDINIIEQINWVKMANLVPVIIQNSITGKVLMLGYMNQDALTQTLTTKEITFYSRSKKRLWMKGESSGNKLMLQDISYDCDQDCLLALVKPLGPTCHTGDETCFGKDFQTKWHIIQQLEKIIEHRETANTNDSYVAHLFASGISRISQKVGEEAVESVIAAMENNNENLCSELADLLFHILVLLKAKNLAINDVIDILEKRMKK